MSEPVDYHSPALNEQVEVALARRRLDFYTPYPKQREFHAASKDVTKTEVLFMAGNQSIGDETPVLTPTGWVPISSIHVGDEVIAGDGTPTRVEAVYPQGVVPLYTLTFDRGETVLASGDHQWVYRDPADRHYRKWNAPPGTPQPDRASRWVRGSTDEIITRVGYTPAPNMRVGMPAVTPIQFPPQHCPVDPYILGVLLGDGSLSGCIRLSSMDPELVGALRVWAATEGYTIRTNGTKDYYVTGGTAAQRTENRLITRLRTIGVWGMKTWNKSIPRSYLFNTPGVRLALLQGLMDTDGTIGKTGEISFYTTSPSLATQVTFLVQSLGGKVGGWNTPSIRPQTHKGVTKDRRPLWTLRIRLPHFNPFRLARKRNRVNSQRHTPNNQLDNRVVMKMAPAQPGSATCIRVANHTHTFVIEHGIVTGNCGKTLAASAQTAIFLTGQYPKWWPGRVFPGPVTGWVAGPTGQSTRDAPQKLLLGESNEWGTGLIPGRNIIEIKKSAHGVPDAVESVLVRHDPTGKESRLQFKTYDQGPLRWAGATISFVHFDEEPPADVYSEGCTRCQVLGGFTYMTFTPLLGMSEVVSRFLQQRPPNSVIIKMGINDAGHYTPEQRVAILARYPEHEREARAYGNPIMGSGKVFPLPWEFIAETPIQIPAYWRRLVGVDFGWDHPTAAAWLAYDPDADTIHITDTYCIREQTPIVHAAAIKARGVWIPVAWPFDGLAHEPGSGKTLADLYRQQGVNMLPTHATHPPLPGKKEGTSGYSTEAGILDMIDRMQTGRLKVFSTLSAFKDEYDVYHRKDGLIVKKGDDIMSASRVGCMAIRHAQTRIAPRSEVLLPPWFPSDVGMGSLG